MVFQESNQDSQERARRSGAGVPSQPWFHTDRIAKGVRTWDGVLVEGEFKIEKERRRREELWKDMWYSHNMSLMGLLIREADFLASLCGFMPAAGWQISPLAGRDQK